MTFYEHCRLENFDPLNDRIYRILPAFNKVINNPLVQIYYFGINSYYLFLFLS